MRRLGSILLVATLAAAQTGPPPPRQGIGVPSWQSKGAPESLGLLEEFVTFDFYGSRLRRDRWRQMRRLTTLVEEPDWKSLYIVKEFELGKPRVQKDAVTTEVRFEVLGRFDVGAGYAPERGTRTVRYHQKWLMPRGSPEGVWLVVEFDPQEPMIGPEAGLEWLRREAAAATNPEWRKKLEQAIADLQRAL